MDFLARIFDWLSEHEAGLSAAVAIMVLAGAVVAGLRAILRRRVAPPSTPRAETVKEEDPLLALPTGPVVAVLPFENLSRGPDQEYFSDGLTDDIITALSRFKDLFVIARNSTFRYKGQAVDVRRLNKELGARYVLEGSVQRAESRLRVTAQLLDGRDGTHLWAETYNRELSASNIFDVQDEITEQVAGTIAGVYGVISRDHLARIKEKPTESLDAYEWVLKTGSYYRDNWDATEHARSRGGLERAVELDAGYSEAWAWLCHTYIDEFRFNFNPRPSSLDRALAAARRAVASDPTSQHAHDSLAQTHFFRREFDAFLAEAERAIALNPNNAGVLAALGAYLFQMGDERGIPLVKKAMVLDPFHPTWWYFPLARNHFKRGEYEEALAVARKLDLPGFFGTPLHLAAIYAELGRFSDARQALDNLLRLYPDFTVEKLIEERRKWNDSEDLLNRWSAALRKAGLPD